jgi:hypothetical protein
VFEGAETAAPPAVDCLDGGAVLLIVAVLVAVLSVKDFRSRPAREGRQTHQDPFDELAFQGWEPATTTTSRTVAKIAKRLMG